MPALDHVADPVNSAAATGLGQDVLYALFRAGLPTDPEQLAMVPAATVTAASRWGPASPWTT